MTANSTATIGIPEPGQLAEVRQRRWLVADVAASSLPPSPLAPTTTPQHLVSLASVEDDGLGEELNVVWELEPGARVLERVALPEPTGFDEPRRLDAFLDAVRWGATSTADLRVLQAPFRSGIELEDYQLDPVVRAIRTPRVNLLIADDVGLGEPATDEAGFAHVGSIDIDFVVDPAIIDAERYATLVELLTDRGYEPVEDSRFQFERTVTSPRTSVSHAVRVDFLTPRPLRGQGRTHRHRTVQRDLQARTLEGAEVALAHWFWYDLEATLPDGGQAQTRVKVSDAVGSLVLKGLAIGDRYVEKDAYDLYALCAHHSGGPRGVADALRPHRGDELVKRGLAEMAEKFRARDAEGPTWVANFLSQAGSDEHERLLTDAYMTVQEVLRLLG